MCGIFGGIGISVKEAKQAINLIKRGDDGITVKELGNEVGNLHKSRLFLLTSSHSYPFQGYSNDSLSVLE